MGILSGNGPMYTVKIILPKLENRLISRPGENITRSVNYSPQAISSVLSVFIVLLEHSILIVYLYITN